MRNNQHQMLFALETAHLPAGFPYPPHACLHLLHTATNLEPIPEWTQLPQKPTLIITLSISQPTLMLLHTLHPLLCLLLLGHWLANSLPPHLLHPFPPSHLPHPLPFPQLCPHWPRNLHFKHRHRHTHSGHLHTLTYHPTLLPCPPLFPHIDHSHTTPLSVLPPPYPTCSPLLSLSLAHTKTHNSTSPLSLHHNSTLANSSPKHRLMWLLGNRPFCANWPFSERCATVSAHSVTMAICSSIHTGHSLSEEISGH